MRKSKAKVTKSNKVYLKPKRRLERSNTQYQRDSSFRVDKRFIKSKLQLDTLEKRFEAYKQNLMPQLKIVLHDNVVSAICKARALRRRVLFAKGKQGGAHKPPRYSLSSVVHCKGK